MTGRTLALSLLLTGVALGGCGRMGDLERPGPETATAPATTADIQSDENRSVSPAPPRTLPIEGLPSNPGEVAPPGALPDPYANPQ